MESQDIRRQFARAAWNGDTQLIRELAQEHSTFVSPELIRLLFHTAAKRNHVEAMQLLVDLGADINSPDEGCPDPEGAIDRAAGEGAADAVRWLLEHGAKINYVVDGTPRCFPLTSAVLGGNLEIVKLLVEHGADFNALWNGQNALGFAIMYGKKEIEQYLRSVGARTPWEIRGVPMPGVERSGDDSVLGHVAKHLGRPEALALREILPGEPSIAIHVVRMLGGKVLVTEGMSSRPMAVSPGAEDRRFAELLMYLPEDWPLDERALGDPNYRWPIEWLRRIALYPHEHHMWLGGKVVFANGEPPRPLAPNTKFTCILAMTESSELGRLDRSDGTHILFYSLYPLYTEERDLDKRDGTIRLVQLFQQYEISPIVDIRRRNVAR